MNKLKYQMDSMKNFQDQIKTFNMALSLLAYTKVFISLLLLYLAITAQRVDYFIAFLLVYAGLSITSWITYYHYNQSVKAYERFGGII